MVEWFAVTSSTTIESCKMVNMDMKKKIVAIIQARMGSTRLPGKVLLNILDRPVLWHLVNRLRRAGSIDEIVVATSTSRGDDTIHKFCIENKINVFRGNESDVLDRFYQAAKRFDADLVIRLTGDCPIIDPEVVEELIHYFLEGHYDHCGVATGAGVAQNDTWGRFPDGLDAEIFRMEVLTTAASEATSALHREHVTPFIWQQPDRFKTGSLFCKEGDYRELRLTLDNIEDFNLISWIYSKLWPGRSDFSINEVIELLRQHPDKLQGNHHLIGQEGYEKFYCE